MGTVTITVTGAQGVGKTRFIEDELFIALQEREITIVSYDEESHTLVAEYDPARPRRDKT